MTKGLFRPGWAERSNWGTRVFESVGRSSFSLPAHAIWLHWEFAEADIHRLDFDITIHNDPGTEIGLYFAPFNGYVGGELTYAGLQTNVQHPKGHGTGKGAIFSTWWTFDAADACVAEPDGFFQLGTHEGCFLGVRRPFHWTAESLRFSLVRLDEPTDVPIGGDGPDSNWFECRVGRLRGSDTPQSQQARTLQTELVTEEVVIGALRFRHCDGQPACFSPKFLSFLEVFAGAKRYREITDFHVDVMAYANGFRASGLRTEYPSFPSAEVPNCDAWFDADENRAHMRMGNESTRRYEPHQAF
jgi:hypothetical protein